MNRYILKVHVLDRRPEIEIDKKRFVELRAAKNTLSQALICEENYEIVIHNYLKLEKEVSGIIIEDIGRTHSNYQTFFNHRLVFNIRISNLLNSAKFYTCTLPRNVRDCLQNKEGLSKIKRIIEEERSGNLSFEFVQGLRNYLQHDSLPTHKTTTGERWTEDDFLEHYTNIFSLKKHLSKDRKLQPILDKMDDEINLILAIRHYIESVSKIHIQARELIKKKVEKARERIQSTLDEYKDADPHSNFGVVALSALHLNKENVEEKIYLLLDLDNIRLI